MPTYEYQCEKCKKTFDVYQSMKDKTLETCPEDLCRQKKWGHGRVKRLLGSGAGFLFKGSGFYITDYRSEGYHTAAKKESGEAHKKETKSESKPAAPKAESKKPPKKSS